MRNRRAFFVFCLAFFTACGSDLAHDSPYDPLSPAEKQVKASVVGRVTLEGESDYSQIDVRLQNDTRTYEVSTDENGEIRLTGVVPGRYQLRIGTRYFEPVSESAEIALGHQFDLGEMQLPARKATVSGLALAEAYEGETKTLKGGLIVRLRKVASIRAQAAAAAPGFKRASDEAPVVHEALSYPNGQYSISGVTPGVYDFTVSSADGTSGEATTGSVTVAGEDVVVEDVIAKPLSGFFTFQDIASLPDATPVTAYPGVTLLLTSSDASEMAIDVLPGVGQCVFGTTEAFAATKTVLLLAEGVNTVCVQLHAQDGQVTGALSRTIVLDTTPPAGSLAVNGGATHIRAADGGVFLDITATDASSGVSSIKVANSADTDACESALAAVSSEPFVAKRAWSLADAGVGIEGDRSVCLLVGDAAGNWSSSPVTATVRYDTAAPVATAGLIGTEAIAGVTAGYSVTVRLIGASSDVAEVMLANDASFVGAGWRAFAAEIAWQLSAGEGNKVVYLKLRDAAGNESVTLQPGILLDRTSPEAPALSLTDFDGDGFAVGSELIELAWTQPSDLDLAGFELQRYIPGVDAGFSTILNTSDSLSYVDAVTATTGLEHFYRIRAVDQLGNYSGWSLPVQAFPFQPIASIAWLWAGDHYRYLFPPNAGVYSLRAALSYRDFNGAEYDEELAGNTPYWNRPVSAFDANYDETFTIRTSNRDNSLSFESVFAGNLKQRQRVGAIIDRPAIAAGPDGSTHIVYRGAVGNFGFWYATNQSGAWVNEKIPGDSNESYPALAVDSLNRAHVMFSKYTTAPHKELYYAYRTTGGWVSQLMDSTTSSFKYDPRIQIDANDRPHFMYMKSLTGLYYAKPATPGTWIESQVSNAVGGTEYAFAVSADGSAHALLCGDVRYATNQSGSWVLGSVLQSSFQTCRPAVALGDDGSVHAAWADRVFRKIHYSTSNNAWSVVNVADYAVAGAGGDVFAGGVDLALYNNVPYIAYTQYKGSALHRIAYLDGTWKFEDVDVLVNQASDSSSLAIGADGHLRMAYAKADDLFAFSGWHLSDGIVNEDTGGIANDVALAADALGTPHVLSIGEYGTTQDNLTYRTRTNGSWSYTKLPYVKLGAPPDIAADQDNMPHIVAQVYLASSPFFSTRYSYRDSGGWHHASFDDLRRPSIAIDGENGIHILASSDTVPQNLQHLYRAPGEALGAPEVIANGYSGKAAVDSRNLLHVAYLEKNGTVYHLRYASKAGGAWETEAIDAVSDVGLYAIAVVADVPHVLYWDKANARIYHAYRVAGSWIRKIFAADVSVTSDFNDTTPAFSLQADVSGNLYAFYFDSERKRYRLGFQAGSVWLITDLVSGLDAGEAFVDPTGRLHILYQLGYTGDYAVRYQTGIFGILPASKIRRVSGW